MLGDLATREGEHRAGNTCRAALAQAGRTGLASLSIRAVLYTFSDSRFWLIGVQIVNRVGAGIFGVLTPLAIAEIMLGTGRCNLAQGAIAARAGIGASLSGIAAGEIVNHFGYSAEFLGLGTAALVATAILAVAMPKTTEWRETRAS